MSIKLKASIALALCAVLFCSCGTKEELFDSYDSCFVPIPSDSAEFVLTPETAKQLLSVVYKVKSFDYASGETFCLSCPVKCDEYYWFVTPESYRGSGIDIENLYKAAHEDTRNGKYYWTGTRDISFYITKSWDCVFFERAMEANESLSYSIYLVVKVGNDLFYDSAEFIVSALTETQKQEFQTDD